MKVTIPASTCGVIASLARNAAGRQRFHVSATPIRMFAMHVFFWRTLFFQPTLRTLRPTPGRVLRWAGMAVCWLAACWLLSGPVPSLRAEEEAVSAVVINEILYAPALETEWLEFVELHNRSERAIDLTEWTLRGGIEFDLPRGSTIPARGYLVVAQQPAALRGKFGVESFGPFAKQLSAEGERIELRDEDGGVADAMQYGVGFPWPTDSSPTDFSIQLINPALNNAAPGAWRSAWPTPGSANTVLVSNAPPLIASVAHAPRMPRAGDAVVVSAGVQDGDGIQAVSLGYQQVLPGEYYGLADAEYSSRWTWIPMLLDESGLYRVTLPSSLQVARGLVRYRIQVTDAIGWMVRVPYDDDPQPNFAYFVHDGLPHWSASPTGGPEGIELFDFGTMRALPVYHFLAKRADIADALFMPPSTRSSGYMGNEYLWHGTLVYNGIVYDHVGFRARGGAFRYATGKTQWKFDFLKGHLFQPVDDFGRAATLKRGKLNLSAGMQRAWTNRRGEQGMFEAMSYRLFDLAGVPAPDTNFVHLRVVDEREQAGSSQYEGDFWGLYLAIEEPDGRFLREHDLPDGNLYKMDVSGPILDNAGRLGPMDGSDVRAFIEGYQNPASDAAWWRQNLDLEGYYSYRAVIEFVRHYDIGEGHNYYYYSNPETGRWSVLPWDVDLTWNSSAYGDGKEPFLAPLLGRPEFQIEYQNRLRELRDLLFNTEQIDALLQERADLIDSPVDGPSMADANRALWDYHPVLTSRYVAAGGWETRPGAFYAGAPDHTFRGMVELMRRFAQERIHTIDSTLLTDRDHPATPQILYAGAAGYPADTIRFRAGDFADPQGADGLAAIEWRVADVSPPDPTGSGAAAPFRPEIDAVWESGERPAYEAELGPPNGVIQAGRAYRARVRMKDVTGRWSHWSAPLEFVAAEPALPVVSTLRISEVMYHPAAQENFPEEELEFVEFFNAGSDPIDLSGMRLVQGVEYLFPSQTAIAPGDYVVLASNPDALLKVYGVKADGGFARKLSNAGDTIKLADAWGRTIAQVPYDDEWPWPLAVDGDGFSMVYNPLAGAPEQGRAWRRSAEQGGSPGRYDPQVVWIHEILIQPEGQRAVELTNPGGEPVDISYWFLGASTGRPRQVWLAQGTVVPGGRSIVLDAARLAESSFDGPIDWESGELRSLVLNSGDVAGRLTGYRHLAQFEQVQPGTSLGRHVDSLGREHFTAMSTVTLGGPNSLPRVGPVVISAIQYAPTTGDEYIELTNITGKPVALYAPTAPQRTWQVHGGFYTFPAGIELPAYGRLLLAPTTPADACTAYAGRGLVRVSGPYSRVLSDTGQVVTLLRPLDGSGSSGYEVVDSVAYSDQAPWPHAGAGSGAALRRATLAGFANDPAHWTADTGLPGIGNAQTVLPALCSLSAVRAEGGRQVSVSWWVERSEDVVAFQLWRATSFQRSDAVRLLTKSVGGAAGRVVQDSHLDPDAGRGDFVVYWLDAVYSTGETAPLGVTSLERAYAHALMPLLSR